MEEEAFVDVEFDAFEFDAVLFVDEETDWLEEGSEFMLAVIARFAKLPKLPRLCKLSRLAKCPRLPKPARLVRLLTLSAPRDKL
jgi:hypothetical protein